MQCRKGVVLPTKVYNISRKKKVVMNCLLNSYYYANTTNPPAKGCDYDKISHMYFMDLI